MINKIKTATEIYVERSSNKVIYRHVRILDDNRSLSAVAEEFIGSNNKEYVPVKKDKIYVFPGCTIPRFKLKQFCEAHDVALVKYSKSANIMITSKEAFTSLFERTFYTCHKKTDVIELFTKHNCQEIAPLKHAVETQESDYVYFKYFNHLSKPLFGRDILDDIEDIGYNDAPNNKLNDEESFEKLKELFSNNSLYNESAILKLLNVGAEINEQEYNRLKDLLESNDNESIKMAIEIMANCDYEKSCVYLLLLISDYGRKIKDSRNRNHVNFKSLLKFFDIQNLHNFDLDDIFNSLLKRKLLNQSNLNSLLPLAIENMRDALHTEYFTFSQVEYSDAIKEGLDENILDGKCDTEITDFDDEEINPKL